MSTRLSEAQRLEELFSFGILDTAEEPIFDSLADAAALVAGTPMALVSLVDEHRQWFKAHHGLDVCSTERDVAFCDHVVTSGRPVTVPDASVDPRFRGNPLVTGDLHLRFYAGFPLRTSAGAVLGSLCVLDVVPRVLDDAAAVILQTLADQVVAQLELRRQLVETASAKRQVELQQTFLDTVLETIDTAVMACDETGRITLFNRAAREQHGMGSVADTAPELVPLRFGLFDEHGTRRLEPDEIPLTRALREGLVTGQMVTVVTAEVGTRRVRVDGRRTVGPDGLVTGAVVALADVTALTDSAAALARAHAEFTDALDALPRSVTLASVDTDDFGRGLRLRVRWVNAHVLRRFGQTGADLVGRTFVEAFPHADAAAYEADFLRVWESGTGARLHYERYSDGAGTRSLDISVVPWQNGLLVDVQDVTSERRAQRALEQSEHRLAEAQRLAGICSWTWDVASDRAVWSASLYELLGVEPGTPTTGELLRLLVPADEREMFLQVTRRALADGGSFCFDHRVVRRSDGRVVHVALRGTVERGADGRPTTVHGTAMDVTESRLRELVLTADARTDPLTGLLNRRGWDAEVPAAERRTRPVTLSLAVAMLDLDHFKRYNDAHGHGAGDDLLVAVGSAWQGALRPGDVLARTGGEEFALLLRDCDAGTATHVVDKLRAATPSAVTASAGVTVVLPGETVQDALGRADRHLYAAKGAGRDRTVGDEPGVAPLPGAGQIVETDPESTR